MIISNEFINYMGRFDMSNGECVKFAWAYSSIKIRFQGTKVSAILESNGIDYFMIIVDGQVHNKMFTVDRRKLYNLVDGLNNSIHTLELIKRTESFNNTTVFYGFELYNGRILNKPSANELKIEIIGDSISCGYGNEDEDENTEFDAKNENSYLAYGPIASRELNADLHLTAWSGLGLVRNGDDSPLTLSERLDWITPLDVNKKWDFKNYIPDLVVINLGTNDMNEIPPVKEKPPSKELYVNEYRKLIDRLISYYGQVKFICAVGPMVSDESLKKLREWIRDGVVDYYNSNGNNNVFFLEHEHQESENGYGGGYHPSLKTHRVMATELINKIQKIIK